MMLTWLSFWVQCKVDCFCIVFACATHVHICVNIISNLDLLLFE